MDEDALLRRLTAARALKAAATTDGERVAAARACERLQRRLADRRAGRRAAVLATFAEHPCDAPEVVNAQPVPPPTCKELQATLQLWGEGRYGREQLHQWAAAFVRGTVLPIYEAENPRSLTMEVVLQLSTLDAVMLQRDDVPRILEVLQSEDPREGWSRWFALLEEVSRRRTPQRASA